MEVYLVTLHVVSRAIDFLNAADSLKLRFVSMQIIEEFEARLQESDAEQLLALVQQHLKQ